MCDVHTHECKRGTEDIRRKHERKEEALIINTHVKDRITSRFAPPDKKPVKHGVKVSAVTIKRSR